MNSSRSSDLILSLYSDARSVFSLNDVAMLIGESDFKKLNERLNYYVRKGKLLRICSPTNSAPYSIAAR